MAEAQAGQGDMILEGFDYTHWQENKSEAKKDYTITADALGFESTDWGMLSFNWLKNMAVYHPTIQFFKNDLEYARLIAGKAYISIPGHDYQNALSNGVFIFEDNPQLVSSNGKILSCTRLNWQRDNTIRGSEGCQLRSNNQVLQMDEMVVNLNLDVL